MSLLDNLKYLWELDGDSLDKIDAKNLVLTGGFYTELNPNGVFPKSLSLDGLDDFLAASDSGLPAGDSERSIVILFYVKSTTAVFLFDYGTGVIGQRFGIGLNLAGVGALSISFVGHRFETAVGQVITNGWNLAIVSVPFGATMTDDLTLCLNGSETALTTTAGSPKTLNTVLGGALNIGRSTAGTLYTEMQGSQIAVYDKALTTEQKAALWNDGNFARILPLPIPPTPSDSPVPIITTHSQDAKNRLLEQYKKEPGVEGLIQSYFGTQVQDLENALQELFGRLNIENSVGVQLDGIGRIVNQDRLGLTDELYRLFLRARIGANVSEGDIERLIEVWKTITQASIVKLEEIFPAEVNLATDVALPDNLIDAAFALIQEVSGAGIGVGITTFLPEDAFAFEGADPAITKGFGSAMEQGAATATIAFNLKDATATFISNGVVGGMSAMNDTDNTQANINAVISETELVLDLDIFTIGEDYYINANTGGQLAKIQGAN